MGRTQCVLVATVAGVVYDDGGGGGGGGSGDGGGEIYTGCQPPNNVIALYKLRERDEQRCSTLKPPSAPQKRASINNTPAVSHFRCRI